MKYLPTLDLWNKSIQAAIKHGQIKLQVGQWVYCGDHKIKSRFVGVKNGVFDIVHGGSHKQVIVKFKDRANFKRISEIKDPVTQKKARIEYLNKTKGNHV